MAASRENVLAAISKYVADNNRRAPAKEIAVLVGDTLPNTQAMIKSLIAAGQVESSRGRYGGAKPVDVEIKAAADAAAVEVDATLAADDVAGDKVDADVADQFAALMAQLQRDESTVAAQDEAAVG